MDIESYTFFMVKDGALVSYPLFMQKSNAIYLKEENKLTHTI